MNNENKYQFINNLPKEYQRILWSIMIKAESNKFVSDCEKLTKQDCKLIMRYLYKKDNEIERLNNIINELEDYVCAIEYDEKFYNETWKIAVRIHNKLKELKESGNNE